MNGAELAADVRARHGLPTQAPLLLYVGGLSPHKNIDGLLRTLAVLHERGETCHLAIVGDTSTDTFLTCYHELQQLVHELTLDDHVTFTGFIPDDALAALYRASTLLVLPSFSEGFGLPVLEAMACGLPVAVSDRFSLPEIVGDAGVLFDPTSIDSMVAAIAPVLNDAARRAAMAEKGLLRAEQYSWRRGAEHMMQLLERAAYPSVPVR